MRMEKRILWLVVSCLMVLSLVMASCGPAEVEEEEVEEEVVEEEGLLPPEVPKYGGVLKLALGASPGEFDNLYGWRAQVTSAFTNDELWIGDWAKGPAGTNECGWTDVMLDLYDDKAGGIAESWDFSEIAEAKITWHIRKGIYWALDPDNEASRLVGGRELTADDVVWTFNRALTDPTAYIYTAAPGLRDTEVTAPDKYTVITKMTSLDQVEQGLRRFGDFCAIYAADAGEQYGGFSDWRNQVSNGPFILTDFVADSSVTFVRNTNYWATDPVGSGKGNQLPYVDGVKLIILPDASTRLASFRTGKIDHLSNLTWEDAEVLKGQNPKLKYLEFLSGHCRPTVMRTDKPELPFHDVRIRRALMMATDFNTMIDTLYGGKAENALPSWPIPYVKEYGDAYLSLEEAPASVQELYTYNPEKARQLLTEAGYPDGFKSEIVVLNDPKTVDKYSVLKDMWAKVNIDVELKPIESGVWNSVSYTRNYDEMFYGSHAGVGTLYSAQWMSGEQTANGSYINNPLVEETKTKMLELVALGKQAEANAMFKDLMKYVLDQAWAIPWPNEYVTTIWWPWLQNFHGENSLGYHNVNKWTRNVWMDEELKESMGY